MNICIAFEIQMHKNMKMRVSNDLIESDAGRSHKNKSGAVACTKVIKNFYQNSIYIT